MQKPLHEKRVVFIWGYLVCFLALQLHRNGLVFMAALVLPYFSSSPYGEELKRKDIRSYRYAFYAYYSLLQFRFLYTMQVTFPFILQMVRKASGKIFGDIKNTCSLTIVSWMQSIPFLPCGIHGHLLSVPFGITVIPRCVEPE